MGCILHIHECARKPNSTTEHPPCDFLFPSIAGFKEFQHFIVTFPPATSGPYNEGEEINGLCLTFLLLMISVYLVTFLLAANWRDGKRPSQTTVGSMIQALFPFTRTTSGTPQLVLSSAGSFGSTRYLYPLAFAFSMMSLQIMSWRAIRCLLTA